MLQKKKVPAGDVYNLYKCKVFNKKDLQLRIFERKINCVKITLMEEKVL